MAPSSHCRIVNGRKGLESSSLGTGSTFSSYLSRSMNSAGHSHSVQKASPNPDEASAAEGSSVDKSSSKSRNRRASEGSHLVKGEGKRSVPELRCERCGKGYKHGSCLSKHMCVYSPHCRSASPGSKLGAYTMSALCQGRPRGHPAPSLHYHPPPFTCGERSRLTFPSSCSGKLGGSTTLRGPSPRSYSSRSTSRYNCWKPPPFWST